MLIAALTYNLKKYIKFNGKNVVSMAKEFKNLGVELL